MEFVVAVFRNARLGDGEYDLHLLGLLQHLPSRRRDPKSREKYSAWNFSFDHRDRGALPRDADEHPRCFAMAAGSRLTVHRKRLHRKIVWRWRGEIRDGDDFVDRVRVVVFVAARV